jgi:hypothetical protein
VVGTRAGSVVIVVTGAGFSATTRTRRGMGKRGLTIDSIRFEHQADHGHGYAPTHEPPVESMGNASSVTHPTC